MTACACTCHWWVHSHHCRNGSDAILKNVEVALSSLHWHHISIVASKITVHPTVSSTAGWGYQQAKHQRYILLVLNYSWGIPLTKGQWFRKCRHATTSLWLWCHVIAEMSPVAHVAFFIRGFCLPLRVRKWIGLCVFEPTCIVKGNSMKTELSTKRRIFIKSILSGPTMIAYYGDVTWA